MSKQRHRHSFIETSVNIAVGFALSFLIQTFIFPWFGLYTTAGKNLAITTIFTVVSFLRSYVLRRIFNKW